MQAFISFKIILATPHSAAYSDTMKKEKGKAKLGRRPIDNYGSRTNIVTGVIGAETLRLLNLHKKKKAVSRIRAVSDIIRDRMHHDGREFDAK